MKVLIWNYTDSDEPETVYDDVKSFDFIGGDGSTLQVNFNAGDMLFTRAFTTVRVSLTEQEIKDMEEYEKKLIESRQAQLRTSQLALPGM